MQRETAKAWFNQALTVLGGDEQKTVLRMFGKMEEWQREQFMFLVATSVEIVSKEKGFDEGIESAVKTLRLFSGLSNEEEKDEERIQLALDLNMITVEAPKNKLQKLKEYYEKKQKEGNERADAMLKKYGLR